MAYVRREYPQWSWSFSRQQAFESCRRMYYYQYCGSHNGWERNAPPLAAAISLETAHQSLHSFGDAVHRGSAGGEEAGPKGDHGCWEEEFIRRKMRSVWQWSVGGREAVFRPKQVPMLHEFYYGKVLDRNCWIGSMTA